MYLNLLSTPCSAKTKQLHLFPSKITCLLQSGKQKVTSLSSVQLQCLCMFFILDNTLHCSLLYTQESLLDGSGGCKRCQQSKSGLQCAMQALSHCSIQVHHNSILILRKTYNIKIIQLKDFQKLAQITINDSRISSPSSVCAL